MHLTKVIAKLLLKNMSRQKIYIFLVNEEITVCITSINKPISTNQKTKVTQERVSPEVSKLSQSVMN